MFLSERFSESGREMFFISATSECPFCMFFVFFFSGVFLTTDQEEQEENEIGQRSFLTTEQEEQEEQKEQERIDSTVRSLCSARSGL